LPKFQIIWFSAEVWSRKVKVDEWHVSWPANEKRYEDIDCRWNIAGVATLCDGNAMLLSTIA
jgi:hypothetical protein